MFANLINGQLAATSDINLVQAICTEPNNKIIFVGDSFGKEDIIQYYRMIMGSILMPDYSIMEAEINGNDQEFFQRYNAYLGSATPNLFIATILAALNQGKNILLFFPPEASGLKYPMALLLFFFNVHGIQVRTDTSPFIYNQLYDKYNADLLYFHNLITPGMYLIFTSGQFDNMIDKLIFDMGVTVSPTTEITDVYGYFDEYRKRMIKTDKYLEKPFSREV